MEPKLLEPGPELGPNATRAQVCLELLDHPGHLTVVATENSRPVEPTPGDRLRNTLLHLTGRVCAVTLHRCFQSVVMPWFNSLIHAGCAVSAVEDGTLYANTCV